MADIRTESVMVIGLGRFGSALALELTSRGTEVLGVDTNRKLVQNLSGRLPHVVVADSTDIEALRQLGIAEFRRAVVAIGTDIQASILTASLLSELEVPDIWAKAINRQHGRILSRVGAHHVVLPEHDMGERVAHLLSGRMLDYIEVDEDFAMVKTKPPRDIVSVPLGETGLRARYGVTVVAVKSQARGDTATFTYATSDTVLMYGDVILVVGTIRDVERFAEVD
ncbi:TrkA family potassium uptake protein [Virgisporangium ochraceum]|uniref:Potassium transporter n=2 Tax=Virgisporangium ochraceum TaxID=65505 RepID=A0A8J4EH49_9ACTN|nr:potassium transporter [Virgisporangium ochraceum]